jgi:hypothetical protein
VDGVLSSVLATAAADGADAAVVVGAGAGAGVDVAVADAIAFGTGIDASARYNVSSALPQIYSTFEISIVVDRRSHKHRRSDHHRVSIGHARCTTNQIRSDQIRSDSARTGNRILFNFALTLASSIAL